MTLFLQVPWYVSLQGFHYFNAFLGPCKTTEKCSLKSNASMPLYQNCFCFSSKNGAKKLPPKCRAKNLSKILNWAKKLSIIINWASLTGHTGSKFLTFYVFVENTIKIFGAEPFCQLAILPTALPTI